MDSIVGITSKNWFKLLSENRYAIDPPFWLKAMIVTFLSFRNTKKRKKEERIYSSEINDTNIKYRQDKGENKWL